ncbi:hypothetical protein ACTXT7_010169 [Hymenolepis weldensis]
MHHLCELLADPWIDTAKMASTTASNSPNPNIPESDKFWIEELTEQSRDNPPTSQKIGSRITGNRMKRCFYVNMQCHLPLPH